MRVRPYPHLICNECGRKYGKNPFNKVESWYTNVCCICGKKTAVTSPKEFGHIMEDWEVHERNK